MDSLQRAVVSLSIHGDDLIPSEITALLGAEPRLGVCKAEWFTASHGKEMQARTGMWHFDEGYESPPDLDRQIGGLFGALSKDSAVWEDLTRRFSCYVSVGGYLDGWTGGMTLHPKTLQALAERHLPIDFDIYAPAASD
jgi:hypothetical protein